MGIEIGDKFNSWTVIEKDDKPRYWVCKCKCGNIKTIQDYTLKSGKSKSCGKCNSIKDKVKIGDTFGDWTVVSDVIDGIKVLCRCSCGKEREVNLYTLSSGKSTSCGHTMNKEKLISLIGNTYGELEVIEYIGYGRWRCRCSCGNIVDRHRNHLLDGRSKSCGHGTSRAPENLAEQRFGKLVAKRLLGSKTWECVCDCGNTVRVLAANLKNKSTISCGCIQNHMSSRDVQEFLVDFIEKNGIKPRIEDLEELWGIKRSAVYYHLSKVEDYKQYIDTTFGSKYERELYNILTSFGVNQIRVNDNSILEGYQVDLYLPEYKLGIEFNGVYWHSELHKEPKYHQTKSVIANRNGIRLIHIFEYEWVDETRKDKIISYIHGIVQGTITIKIEDCQITEITNTKLIKNFIGLYSFNEVKNYDISIGCYYNGDLIGIATFNKCDDECSYEIIELCWKFGYTVDNGENALINYFIKSNNPGSLVAYCDISKVDNNLYKNTDMQLVCLTDPDFQWVSLDNMDILRRIKNDGVSYCEDIDIMYRLGYIRIFDCGKLKYIWYAI